MSLRFKLGGVFLAAVVVRVGFHLYTGFVADDAFITFRYAENLASGNGFVYNLGERVLGTSTPLFAWILSVLRLLYIGPPIGSLLISILCAGLTAALLYRFAALLRFGSLALIPALVYVVWPRSVPADSSGMETALYTLLVTAAFYYQHRKLRYYAIGLATLASLTRPEGALVLLLLLISSCKADCGAWKRYLSTPALLLIPWLAFAQFYFGSIVPHAITAKLALYSRFGAEGWIANLTYILGLNSPVGWMLIAAALLGGTWLIRKQDFGQLEATWLLVTISFYTFGGSRLFFWYLAPLYPVFILLGAASVLVLSEKWKTWHIHQTRLLPIVVVGVIAVGGLGLYRQADYFRSQQTYAESVLKPAAAYLAEQVNLESETVAAEDIGQIGYYSRCRILDRDGLVSPAAVAYNHGGRYLDLVLDLRPDWVGAGVGSPISLFVDTSRFLEYYELARSFPNDTAAQYVIYRRSK
ncbi:MAG: hypothetical protein AB1772_01915 [Candidatus Zixiibacteriota bacterium]